MAFSLKHAFTSAKADGADATQVQPSNWNAEHTLTLSGRYLIGRTAAGSGTASELPLDDYRVPAGAVLPYAGSTLPSGGYLWPDGSAVSRTTYADLYSAIGTTYGVGDGSTTFNLPNTSGRVLAGKEATATLLTSGVGGVDGATLGATGGAQSKTAATTSTGSASGVVNIAGYTGEAAGGTAVYAAGGGGVATGYDHVHYFSGSFGATFSAAVSGTSSAFSVVQPTLVLNFIIKT